MGQPIPLSEKTHRRLLMLGLSPSDVECLTDRLTVGAEHAQDAPEYLAALRLAAQGGDPVAVKLACLPAGDPVLAEVARAFVGVASHR